MTVIRHRGASATNDTLEIIKALIEFSKAQKLPIEKTIDEYLPMIYSGNSARDLYDELEKKIEKLEAVINIHQNQLVNLPDSDQIHELALRIALIENNIRNLETEVNLNTKKAERRIWIITIGFVVVIILLTVILIKQYR